MSVVDRVYANALFEAARDKDRLDTVREHVDDHGLCAVCASAWPCERAHLADAALAGL